MKWGFGLALAAAALTGACAQPAGTDANLVNGWPLPSAAAWWTPVTGHCYTGPADLSSWYHWTEFSCGAPHRVDVVGTGDITGALAARDTPPAGADLAATDTVCANDADGYIGGDMRDGWFKLDVEVPTLNAWASGNHTYVCGLTSDTGQDFTGAVKGDLAGPRAWARGCGDLNSAETGPADHGFVEYVGSETPAPCAQPHNAEYVGRFAVTGTQDTDDDRTLSAYWNHCESLAASYLATSVTRLEHRTDLRAAWVWADQGVLRCYLLMPQDKKASKSVKGIGSGPVV